MGFKAVSIFLATSSLALGAGFVTTSDGVKIHYLESGSGPAILFVPGWTMPAEIWQPQIDHFAKKWRVIVMDPRSQGESTKATEGHYPERRSADIQEVVGQLELAPVVLVGWSLGVAELLAYVEQFGTSRVRALVLVDGLIGEDLSPKLAAGLASTIHSMQVDRRKHTAEFVRSMYKKPQPEEYFKRITEASLKTPTNTAVTLLANYFHRIDRRDVLPKLNRPVLFTVTSQLKAQGEILRSRVATARVEVFEDAGHALFVDEAGRFNRLLDEFLRAALPDQ